MKREKRKDILCPPVNNKLLKEITRRIVTKIKPQKIILFGSYAYGKPGKDSDLDLFVVKNTSLPASKRFGLVSDALYPRLIPMDFIVKTPREVKERLNSFDVFLKEIFTCGKVLYEKNNIVCEWVEKAEGDYETVIDLRKKRRKKQQYIIAFHCQQCIEKYLKALLSYHNLEFPRHHDLEELLVLLLDKDPLLSVIRNYLKVLTPFAVSFRCPGDKITPQETRNTVKTMLKLRIILRKRLGFKK